MRGCMQCLYCAQQGLMAVVLVGGAEVGNTYEIENLLRLGYVTA